MKRRDEVLVGLLLTVAVVVGIVGTIWLVRGGLSSGYPLYARFAWGEGLKQGQPVFLVGVNVGFVSEIELRQDGTLVVEMNINDDYQVPEGTTAQVQSVGFFGDRAIALTPAGPARTFIASGDTVPTGKSGVSLDQILARVDTVGRSASDVARAIEVQLVDSGALRDLRSTLSATNRLVLQLSQVVALQSRELQLTLATARRTVAAVDSTQVDSTVRYLRQASENLAQLTTQFQGTTERLNSVLARLESGEGTAAKLLNDPGLYDDMRRLLTRVDSLTVDFKKNPRRYINLEIF
jgi:phospholipid/cholesterol/gamma-HCH transport system substrate-binding protein